MAVSQPNDYENYDPYGTYQTKGEDPYSLLMKMSSWNKAIRSTISEVTETLEGTMERQSQIIQEVDKIQISVLDILTGADGAVTRIGKLEVRSDAITLSVSKIDTRVGSAEATILVQAGQIALKAATTTVTALGTRMGQAEITISAHTSSINLKAASATVDALGTRVNTAEININGLNGTISSKVSTTDYNGNTIVSMINQSPYYVTIDAAHINLVGAVYVLSDISGSLGDIYSGTMNSVYINSAYIDIYESASIGNGLYLRGGNMTGIYFGDGSQVVSSGGSMTLEAWNSLYITGYSVFNGSVDFSGASVSGLDGGSGPTTVRYSSSSHRLYIDQYGSQIGYVNVI